MAERWFGRKRHTHTEAHSDQGANNSLICNTCRPIIRTLYFFLQYTKQKVWGFEQQIEKSKLKMSLGQWPEGGLLKVFLIFEFLKPTTKIHCSNRCWWRLAVVCEYYSSDHVIAIDRAAHLESMVSGFVSSQQQSSGLWPTFPNFTIFLNHIKQHTWTWWNQPRCRNRIKTLIIFS